MSIDTTAQWAVATYKAIEKTLDELDNNPEKLEKQGGFVNFDHNPETDFLRSKSGRTMCYTLSTELDNGVATNFLLGLVMVENNLEQGYSTPVLDINNQTLPSLVDFVDKTIADFWDKDNQDWLVADTEWNQNPFMIENWKIGKANASIVRAEIQDWTGKTLQADVDVSDIEIAYENQIMYELDTSTTDTSKMTDNEREDFETSIASDIFIVAYDIHNQEVAFNF